MHMRLRVGLKAGATFISVRELCSREGKRVEVWQAAC